MKKITFLLLAFVTIIACNTQKNIPETSGDMAGNSNFEVIKQDAFGGREMESHMLITTQEELDALYRELNIEFVRPVDFTTENVIALFMGQRTSGGYGIGIEKVIEKNNKITVRRNYTEPQNMATAVISAPYCVAIIPAVGTNKLVVE